MTVSFDILDHEWPADRDGLSLPPASMFVQISNVNARDFFCWIGFADTPLYGEMPARQLAALLRRRLWPERRQSDDPGRPAAQHRVRAGAVVIDCGRAPGRLAAYAERLLALAEFAGDGTIIWS